MGPNGSKNWKSYSSYKSQPNVFKLTLNFPPNGLHKTTLGIFEILSFRFLTFFFFIQHFKLSIVPYKPQTSIVWKTSDRRAKWNKICNLWLLVEYIWRTFHLTTLKTIWGHLIHLRFFVKIFRVAIRAKRYSISQQETTHVLFLVEILNLKI